LQRYVRSGQKRIPVTHERVDDPASQRFGRRIERQDGLDFPYYNGKPVWVNGHQWILVVVAVLVAYAILVTVEFENEILSFIPIVALPLLPLVALAVVTRGRWTALYHRVAIRDFGLVAGFIALGLVVAAVMDVIVRATVGTAGNPEADELVDSSLGDALHFLVSSAIQIMGEELFVILPFLALLYLFVQKFGWGRNSAVVVALIVTSIVFGLSHLPTYDWNWAQCLLVIGVGRIFDTYVYIRTKNLWLSYATHLLGDWLLFGTPLVLGAVAT